MRKLLLPLILCLGFIWSCQDRPDFQPILQPVQLEQPFWVRQGESFNLGSEDLIFADMQLDGWHARGIVGPHSVAHFTINGEEFSIMHRVKCEFEFEGKEMQCTRDDAFFERLDEFSAEHSRPDEGAFREVALLDNGLKLYMLFVEPDPDRSRGDFIEIRSAEFLLRKE